MQAAVRLLFHTSQTYDEATNTLSSVRDGKTYPTQPLQVPGLTYLATWRLSRMSQTPDEAEAARVTVLSTLGYPPSEPFTELRALYENHCDLLTEAVVHRVPVELQAIERALAAIDSLPDSLITIKLAYSRGIGTSLQLAASHCAIKVSAANPKPT